jgi:ubiquinone/menaquinone biosynthesis C-methylase UbiE
MEEANYDHCEQLAALHGTGHDRMYDLEALVAGDTLMGPKSRRRWPRRPMAEASTVLTCCTCNVTLACDSITLARLGGRITSVDFSPTALARLNDLAKQCGVEVTTVEADSRDLPHELDQSFDLVYSTIGVLCWIDDLDAWMKGVARILRSSGSLMQVELHRCAPWSTASSPRSLISPTPSTAVTCTAVLAPTPIVTPTSRAPLPSTPTV